MVVDEKVVPAENETQPATAEDYFGYDPKVFDAIKEKVDTETPKEDSVDPTELINKTLKEIQVDEKGKFIYPENIDPVLKAAVAATKSFRDTQSSYTKAQQELKALQAEAEALREQVAKYETPTAGLSQEEQQELAELKYTNPDEWYKRMKALETQATQKVEEKFKEVREQAKEKTVQEQRLEAFEKFNETRENKLTKEMLEFDVPPRWAKEVEEGKLDFDEYLDRAYNFIYGNKTVVNPDVPNTTDLNEVPGGDKDPQLGEGIDYSKITF
jgi:hypothetical protein